MKLLRSSQQFKKHNLFPLPIPNSQFPATNYRLSTIGYQLLAIGYRLSTTGSHHPISNSLFYLNFAAAYECALA
jgi:hypothetical protein